MYLLYHYYYCYLDTITIIIIILIFSKHLEQERLGKFMGTTDRGRRCKMFMNDTGGREGGLKPPSLPPPPLLLLMCVPRSY